MTRLLTSSVMLVIAALAALSGCGSAQSSGAARSDPAATPNAETWTVSTESTLQVSTSTLAPQESPKSTPTVPPTPPTQPVSIANESPSPRIAPGAFERPSRGGVELPPTSQGALAGRVVVVDPGHNGVYDNRINSRQVPAGNGRRKACNTSGTANGDVSEHALNWEVADLLASDLRARGAAVWLTRPDDHGVGPCVDERAGIGNRVGADLVVSVHADGNTSPSARGFHVITSQSMKGGPEAESRSQDLARLVRDEMLTTGMPTSTYLGRKGIDVRSDIAGVNLSEPPAVMLEMGNMHHREDAALFTRPEFRRKVADALANAVTTALG